MNPYSQKTIWFITVQHHSILTIWCQAIVQRMLGTQAQELVRRGKKLEKSGIKGERSDISQVLAPKCSINKTHRLKLNTSVSLHLRDLTQRHNEWSDTWKQSRQLEWFWLYVWLDWDRSRSPASVQRNQKLRKVPKPMEETYIKITEKTGMRTVRNLGIDGQKRQCERRKWRDSCRRGENVMANVLRKFQDPAMVVSLDLLA